jgi:hypothetical protein
MVKTVTWAGEATKFFKKNKGKNGIHSFSDALKSPELKKQYELAKKGGFGGYGEEEEPRDDVNNNEVPTPQVPVSTQSDGGNEIEPQAPAPAVIDGGNDVETRAAQMDGGKRKKSARRTKKSKKSKTVKKQRKYKK